MEAKITSGEATEEFTYYELFGLDSSATLDTITEVFRELSLRLQAKAPDLNEQQLANAHSLFASVQEAYEVLRDPEKRALYDAQRKQIDEDKKDLHTSIAATNTINSITSQTVEAMSTTAAPAPTVNPHETGILLNEPSTVVNFVTTVATAMVTAAVSTATDKTVEMLRQEEEEAIADQIELDNFLNERMTTDALVEASRDQIQRLLGPTNDNMNILQRSLDISTQSNETPRMTPISILKTPETPRDPERRKTVTFNDPVLHVLVSEPASRSTSGDRSSLEVQPASSDVDRSSLPRLEQVLFP